MPIYTRRGDKGQTSLFGGTRVLKSNDRVDTYGTIDELDSVIGVVVAQSKHEKIKQELERIQHDLLDIGSNLANPQSQPIERLKERVDAFEKMIDEMTAEMPPLRNFILPGGGIAGAMLHQARTVCRRAERRLVNLQQTEQLDEHLVKYINRLSDLLFTLARYSNHLEKKKETIWKKVA